MRLRCSHRCVSGLRRPRKVQCQCPFQVHTTYAWDRGRRHSGMAAELALRLRRLERAVVPQQESSCRRMMKAKTFACVWAGRRRECSSPPDARSRPDLDKRANDPEMLGCGGQAGART